MNRYRQRRSDYRSGEIHETRMLFRKRFAAQAGSQVVGVDHGIESEGNGTRSTATLRPGSRVQHTGDQTGHDRAGVAVDHFRIDRLDPTTDLLGQASCGNHQ